MHIRDYLKSNKILADGSFGTFFAAKYNTDVLPESVNTKDPEQVAEIHREYINAGANLIRTNTFSSNRASLHCDEKELVRNIRSACRIALTEANKAEADLGRTVFVAGDIGPVPKPDPADAEEEHASEYQAIIDAMIQEGIRVFVFETFSDTDDILESAEYIRERLGSEAFIIAQFCVNQHGYTNRGLSGRKLIGEVMKASAIDACGFNCGVGPGSMEHVLDSIGMDVGKYISVMPNAGFPNQVANRIVFRNNIDYFVDRMNTIAEKGVDIIGGCCGTDPQYIKRLSDRLSFEQKKRCFKPPKTEQGSENTPVRDSSFWNNRSSRSGKLVTIELSPPLLADDEKLMDAANKAIKVSPDAISIPDSPSGRTRADSAMMGMKIYEETKINVIPHICCRDKNIIAHRSYLLGAYLNGIRNFLVITGDPVPTMLRQSVKSVFNFDSVGLMKLMQEMNEEYFRSDPIVYGGAINPGRRNLDVEKGRVLKKIDAGARFFVTQPVFTESEMDKVKSFYELIKERDSAVKLLCGVMPLVSRKNALFMQNEMAGIEVTDEISSLFGENMTKAEGEAVGVSIAKNVMEYMEEFVDGYCFSIPFNRVYMLDDIL